jgi:cytochrome P450
MRKIFSPAFSETALRKQEPLFRRYIDLMIRTVKTKLSDEDPKPFNIVELFNFTTFDIMGDLAFGEPLNLLENSSYSPWIRAVFDNVKALTIFRLLAYFPPLQDIAWYLAPKSLKDQRDDHDRYSAERVDRRLANKRQQPDIWNIVLTQGEGNNMSLEEMHENASLFMIAGTETTATLLSGLTFLLLKNQKCMKSLIEEIRSYFTEETDIKLESLVRLPYLNACIEEALRLYPPVPTGIPRAAPPKGTMICGKWVPGGVSSITTAAVFSHR